MPRPGAGVVGAVVLMAVVKSTGTDGDVGGSEELEGLGDSDDFGDSGAGVLEVQGHPCSPVCVADDLLPAHWLHRPCHSPRAAQTWHAVTVPLLGPA